MHALRGSHLQRNLPEEDREPACVRACPTGARAFGDLGDPDSAVSRTVADRGGFDLLEEFGYKPVNKYLPPRAPAAPPYAERRRGRKDRPPARPAGAALRLDRPTLSD
jgi:Fe-S-cluster-containing dehydrogenase component